MTDPQPQPRPIRVLPIPDSGPPILTSWREAMPEPAAGTGYVQGTLAVQFGPDAEDERAFGPQPTPTSSLPEPTAWAAHLAQAVVEVLGGHRPAPQLIRWTAPEVYATVTRRHAVSARRGLASGRRPVVRRVLVCEPADGVAEACAVVVDGTRVRALAMRFEGLDRRWVMTKLQIG